MSGLLRGFGFGASKAKAGFGYPVSVPTGTTLPVSPPSGFVGQPIGLLLLLTRAA